MRNPLEKGAIFMSLKIEGQLKDDIINGRAVLFFGAGVGQAAGLNDAIQLTNYLFNKAGEPPAYSILGENKK